MSNRPRIVLSTHCSKCGKVFGFWVAKHVCRGCGFLFCIDCCQEKCKIPQFAYHIPVKVCCACKVKFAPPKERIQHISKSVETQEEISLALQILVHNNQKNLMDQNSLSDIELSLKACDEEFMQLLEQLDNITGDQEYIKMRKSLVSKIQRLLEATDWTKQKLQKIKLQQEKKRQSTSVDTKIQKCKGLLLFLQEGAEDYENKISLWS